MEMLSGGHEAGSMSTWGINQGAALWAALSEAAMLRCVTTSNTESQSPCDYHT